MLRSMKSLGNLGIVIGAVICCLAPAARADEMHYLPNGCVIYFSVDLAAFLKSKIYHDAKDLLRAEKADIEHSTAQEFGIPAANIARITAGTAPGRYDHCVMARTIKPITAAEIKAAKKPQPYQKNLTFKEIKVRPYRIYEENFQYDFDFFENKDVAKVRAGEAFCVVEDHLVIRGKLETLKAILGRRQKSAPSPGVQAGLKQAGPTSTLTVCIEPRAFPAEVREEFLKVLAPVFPGVAELVPNIQAMTLRANEDGKIKLNAAILCNTATDAIAVKKAAEAGRIALNELLKDEPDLPAEERKAKGLLRASLDAIKLSIAGTQVHAEVAVERATAIQLFQLSLGTKKKVGPLDKKK